MLDEQEWGLYDNPQDVCPKCGSDDICNEDGPDDGLLPVTCHNCGYCWSEPYLIISEG